LNRRCGGLPLFQAFDDEKNDGRGGEEGSILGGLGDILGGDR
jgi:hypothetical protein